MGDTYFNRGNAHFRRGEFVAAAAMYRQALARVPQDADAWNNLGKTCKELNQLEEAAWACDQAILLRPDFIIAHCNRAIVRLALGQFAEGLADYEWRWRLMTSRGYTQPRWGGEMRPAGTLLLHAEQGFGDMLQFVRFVRLARGRVGRVVLECQPALRRLFELNACADAVIEVGETPPPFDCYLPVPSLPRVLGVELGQVGEGTPYLIAPAFGNPVPEVRTELNVGLAWAGSARHQDDAVRSLRLEQLDPLLAVPGVRFFSLQVLPPPGDLACLHARPEVTDLGPQLTDFYVTAGVAARMDLIIAADTAVAHLGGALGRPTWTLIQHSPDWRWQLNRPDTPWYSTMRLFRQAQRGAWGNVIERVARELAAVVARAPEAGPGEGLAG